MIVCIQKNMGLKTEGIRNGLLEADFRVLQGGVAGWLHIVLSLNIHHWYKTTLCVGSLTKTPTFNLCVQRLVLLL